MFKMPPVHIQLFIARKKKDEKHEHKTHLNTTLSILQMIAIAVCVALFGGGVI